MTKLEIIQLLIKEHKEAIAAYNALIAKRENNKGV